MVGALRTQTLSRQPGRRAAFALLLLSALFGALLGATSALAADEGDLAKQVFRSRCQSCHGAEGKGDGMMARALSPPPASFADPAWQVGIDDDAIKAIILKGGLAVGKSPAMPPHADLGRRPGVLKHLVALVRSFGAGGPPLLTVTGRSDLRVRVEGGAEKTDKGFSLSRGKQTWSFTTNSGVTEPDKGSSSTDVLTARARAWMARTGGEDARRSIKTSISIQGDKANRKQATTIRATVVDPTQGTCSIYVAGGEPSGGFVPWLEAISCGPDPHPPFNLVFQWADQAPAAGPHDAKKAP